MKKYLDLNYLKSLNLQPYWFGLGFIKLELNPDTDLHFWSNCFPLTNTNEIHNHWRNFRSWILKGRIQNKIYDLNPKGHPYIHTILKQKQPLIELQIQNLHIQNCITYESGHDYYMHADILHDAKFLDATVTLLKYDGAIKDQIDIFRTPNTQHVSPNMQYPVEKLWQEIQRIIEK